MKSSFYKSSFLVGVAVAGATIEHKEPARVCDAVIEYIMNKPTYQTDVLEHM